MEEEEAHLLEDARRLRRLQDWLMIILEERHHHGLITEYSRHCFDLGLHAPEVFEAVCTPEDIFGFDWMEPRHKQLLVTKVYMPYKKDWNGRAS